MPAEFLMQQLQWREALDDARDERDRASLQALDDDMAGANATVCSRKSAARSTSIPTPHAPLRWCGS